MDEEIFSDEEVDSVAEIELKRLEFQEWDKEHENQLHIKKLELKECELSIQLKMKELDVEKSATNPIGRLGCEQTCSLCATFPRQQSGQILFAF